MRPRHPRPDRMGVRVRASAHRQVHGRSPGKAGVQGVGEGLLRGAALRRACRGRVRRVCFQARGRRAVPEPHSRLPAHRCRCASAAPCCGRVRACCMHANGRVVGSRDDAHARARARVRSLPRVRGLEQLRASRLQRSAGSQPERRLQNVSINVQAHTRGAGAHALHAGWAQATDMPCGLCALRCEFTSQGIKNFCGVILQFGGKAWRVSAGARPCRFP
jgi:hypothetical protein